MTPDPFPNELVEAAAKAIVAVVDDKLQWNVNAYGKAWTGEMDDTEFLCGGAAEAVLAAVLPLIEQRVKDQLREGSVEKSDPTDAEKMRAAYDAGAADAEQRVIDRLAREAGENPYPEFHLPEHDGATGYADPCHAAWDEGAACGVAAERARCPLCDHEWRRHDPVDGRCDCHSETIIGPCQCGRDLAWMQERIAAMSCAALAPERTGEGT